MGQALVLYHRVSSPCLLVAGDSPLRGLLRPHNSLGLQLSLINGPPLAVRWHRQIIVRAPGTFVRLRRVLETGNPGRRDHLASLDPLPTGGWEVDSAPLRLSATRKIATTWLIKEQFPSSLGYTHSDSSPTIRDGRMLTSRIRTCSDTDILSPYIQMQRVCHPTNMTHVGELVFPHP